MLTLRIVQAEFGDCFILQFGTTAQPRYVLVDSGPQGTYEHHLHAELRKIRDGGGKLELAIVSHVDADHIIGLLDLLAELRAERADERPETIAIDRLWHNAFNKTIGNGNDIETRIKSLLASAGPAVQAMPLAGIAVQGIGQGHGLRVAAVDLRIPVNAGFPNDLVSVEEAPEPVALGNLRLQIVGPTRENLDALKREWLEWLEEHEQRVQAGGPAVAAMADRSIPNLSSIMVLAEADGKQLLLTGDGRGDHLLDGLEAAKLLHPGGRLHVDVLKVPHHGSDRNVNREFFTTITADMYVISANGKYGNPDFATLGWIVEAAKEQRRKIEVLVTNRTPSTEKLVRTRNPAKYGYRLRAMPKRAHALSLEVAP